MESHGNIGRQMIFGLTKQCPHSAEHTCCPFSKYRQKTIRETYDWVKALTDTEVDAYLEAHRECALKMEREDRRILAQIP